MSSNAMPPDWADAVLRSVLAPGQAESVSGDLIEQYRDSVLPARGPQRADTWYVRQIAGLVCRKAAPWAVLFSASFVGRTILDWLVPTTDFYLRSQVTTLLGVGILLLAACRAASRSGSLFAGPLVGVATAALAAPITLLAASAALAVWHDPATMTAIRQSGGLDEVFTLPLFMVLPAMLVGIVGGGLGAGYRRLRPA